MHFSKSLEGSKSAITILYRTFLVKPSVTFLVLISKSKIDKTQFEHKHDVRYHGKYPETQCIEDYVVQTARRLNERAIEHCGRDVNSYINSLNAKVAII